MKRLIAIAALAVIIAASHVSHSNAATPKVREQKIAVAVTSKGFVPATIKVKAGQPVCLVVTRKVERTCATDIVVKGYGINKPLPLNRPVDVRFTPKKAGTIRYACAMDMIAGQLLVN